MNNIYSSLHRCRQSNVLQECSPHQSMPRQPYTGASPLSYKHMLPYTLDKDQGLGKECDTNLCVPFLSMTSSLSLSNTLSLALSLRGQAEMKWTLFSREQPEIEHTWKILAANGTLSVCAFLYSAHRACARVYVCVCVGVYCVCVCCRCHVTCLSDLNTALINLHTFSAEGKWHTTVSTAHHCRLMKCITVYQSICSCPWYDAIMVYITQEGRTRWTNTYIWYLRVAHVTCTRQ